MREAAAAAAPAPAPAPADAAGRSIRERVCALQRVCTKFAYPRNYTLTRRTHNNIII